MTSASEQLPRSVPVEARVEVTHPIGLHARPSLRLTQLAKRFGSDIRLRAAEAPDWIDAKSIVRVMALKVKVGQILVFRADGRDARTAVSALVDLVARDFEADAG